MVGSEVFLFDNDTESRTGQRETVIVTNSPVTCEGPRRVQGWEYIPKGDNSDGPALFFGFVRDNGAGGELLL